MKFKTLFMSDKEKHGHHFNLPPLFLMCQQYHVNLGENLQGTSRELALRPPEA